MGFSDARIAQLMGTGTREARGARAAAGGRHHARLQARGHLRGRVRVPHALPLLDLRDASARPSPPTRKKVMILGSGPNRIGQGIEFDYCCCHASFAFKEEGYETIMVNCNPETVSTDYDTSDRLYFEPLTFEDVMNIVELEKPEGVVIQFGGQTPLQAGAAAAPGRRARSWAPAPTPSTWPRTASASARCSRELDIPQPESGTATSLEEAKAVAAPHRLPGAGAALVRAGRAGHGHRLRRGAPGGLRARGGARPRPSTRSWSTASWRTPTRWTWTRWPTASAW